MVGLALNAGHELVDDPDDADTIVVNTCSFIGEAKKESVDAILAMAQVKDDAEAAGESKQLVVSGCLAQRYVDDLTESLPEVDHFIGTSDFAQINAVLPGGATGPASDNGGLIQLGRRNLVTEALDYLADDAVPRVNSMAQHTAYLKISEGCDNSCAFCIIPKLRGKQRSRPIADLVAEAERLAASGVVELNLIAQDLTAYGHDLDKSIQDGDRLRKPALADLLAALAEVEGIAWVRCMYAYPRTLSAELFTQLREGRNTLPYLDIPTQHASDAVLRRMKRGRDQRRLTELLLSIRDAVPGVVLRSTVMGGFPGETDADFDELVDFVQRVQFERLGVFKYSNEEDTAAYELDGQVPYKIKRSRFDKLMRRQRRVHRAWAKNMIGQVHEAVVDGPSEEHEYLVVGRLWCQAPEIDGMTYLSSTRPLSSGEIVRVRITDAHDYDLVGEVLDDSDPTPAAPFAQRRGLVSSPLGDG